MKMGKKLFNLVLTLLGIRLIARLVTGTATRYADITSLVNTIYEGALFTLRARNLLVATVSIFTDQIGLNPRKVTRYGTANVRERAEGADRTATQFNRSLLNTLTPVIYSDQFLLTDQRLRSDTQNVRDDAVMELGEAFATKLDEDIAGQFDGLTGGTIGAYAGTLDWKHVVRAKSTLRQRKAPGPFFCVLGEGQWSRMLESAGLAANKFEGAPMFQDRLVDNYYINRMLGDVIFVITPNIQGGATANGLGAMYNSQALAYDERLAFTIEPDRDASRTAWELNADAEYAVGTWDASRGVQLRGTDVIASS
jgi:hypothetical protein